MISDLQWIYTSTKQNLYWLIGLHLFKYRPVVAKCIWYDYLVAVTLWKVGSLVAIVSFGPEKVTHWTHYDVKSVAICSAFITDRALIVRVWAVLWHSIYPSSFDGLEFKATGQMRSTLGFHEVTMKSAFGQGKNSSSWTAKEVWLTTAARLAPQNGRLLRPWTSTIRFLVTFCTAYSL